MFSAHNSGKYQNLSDAKLLSLVADGDTLAEEALVIRYTPMVYSFTRTCYRDGWERADFVQEGMLGLIKAIREYKENADTPFAAYASVCIRNELYAALRKALNSKNLPLAGYISLSSAEGPALAELLSDDSEEQFDKIINGDEAKRLIAALSRGLSPFEKKVLAAWLRGFDTKETSIALGKSQKSVDNAITRIRNKAKSLCGNPGAVPKV
jgi:RNA polymerase sporulation-specific sigma factor